MRQNDRGSVVVEALLLVPVLMMLVLLSVYVGRWTTSSQRISRAADVAARAASQSSMGKMTQNGRLAAVQELKRIQSGCSHQNVDIKRYSARGVLFVQVDVECVLQTVDLSLLRLPARRIHARSLEVIDVYTKR